MLKLISTILTRGKLPKDVKCDIHLGCASKNKFCHGCKYNKNVESTRSYHISEYECWCCGNTNVALGCICHNCGEVVNSRHPNERARMEVERIDFQESNNKKE